MTDIIIVKFGQKDIEDNCISSVLRSTSSPYHLTVYDNFIQKENLAKVWNRLISQSNADYICLLNSDTLVTMGWLENLLEAFGKDPRLGAVGPSTNKCGNQQCKPSPVDPHKSPFLDFGRTFPNWCLSGFCLVFPRSVWEEVKGFPEDCGFYGQETAFIDKLTKRGYKQCWRTDTFVFHYGGYTAKKTFTSEELQKEREKGNTYIKEKRA